MDLRYTKNMPALSLEENKKLMTCTVCVVGCGGIGGYVVEMLGRIGIGKLIVVDHDFFEESNLNRQILSTNNTMGLNKAIVAKKRLEDINPLVQVETVTERFSRDNAMDIISDADIVIDALDNLETRLILERACEKKQKPLVHGAINGWFGQVTTIFPKDRTLSKLYTKQAYNQQMNLGNPTFTPALVAAIEVSEVVKLLINRGEILRNKLLHINLLSQNIDIIEI